MSDIKLVQNIYYVIFFHPVWSISHFGHDSKNFVITTTVFDNVNNNGLIKYFVNVKDCESVYTSKMFFYTEIIFF